MDDRPTAFSHYLAELRATRRDVSEQRALLDPTSAAAFDASEDAWRRLEVVLERKIEERGRLAPSLTSTSAIMLLEELRAAYRTIRRPEETLGFGGVERRF